MARLIAKSAVVAAIGITEFRRVVRDRTALFFMLVLPVAIIVIVGVVFGSAPAHLTVGVVDMADTQESHKLVEALGEGGGFDIIEVDRPEMLERNIRTNDLMAGLVITGSGDSLDAQTGPPRVEIYAPPDSTMVLILKAAVGSAANGAVMTNLNTETIGTDPMLAENQYAYTAPANLVLFVFINSVSAGAAMVESRRLGVTRRMLAAPVSPTMVIMGFGLNRLLFALVQSLLILLVGSVVFGVQWGSPPAVAALILVWSLVGASAGLMVGAVARTPEQVNSIGTPVSLGMSMLGGCLWPLAVVGATMRAVGHLTPHAWAVDAWVELVFEGATVGDIAGNLMILALVAVVLTGMASWRLKRVLLR